MAKKPETKEERAKSMHIRDVPHLEAIEAAIRAALAAGVPPEVIRQDVEETLSSKPT